MAARAAKARAKVGSKKSSRVQLVVETGPHADVPAREINRRANAMLDALQLKEEELSIVLTGDDQIHELNKLYRGKDRPTDVLAFAQREGEFASISGEILGDVVISVETARRQARAAKRDVMAEVTMLLAHGLLHLLGWDHETAAKDRKMRAETDRLVEASLKSRKAALKSKSRSTANVLSSPAKPHAKKAATRPGKH